MISIMRISYPDYNEKYIGINTFIKIKQTVYKHIATAVFAKMLLAIINVLLKLKMNIFCLMIAMSVHFFIITNALLVFERSSIIAIMK